MVELEREGFVTIGDTLSSYFDGQEDTVGKHLSKQFLLSESDVKCFL